MWRGGGMNPLAKGLSGTVVLLVDTILLLLSRTAGSGPGGSSSGPDCPRLCFCNTLSQIVYCSRRGLATIPQGIPAGTKELNMNGNIFLSSALQRANFSNVDSLKHLYLSECGIETIEENTFSDLENLLWLDLSNNRIKLVPDFTFRGLTLQHLFLNGNRNIQLRSLSFEGLVTTGLYLHDCGITTLLPEVLSPLNSTLRYLWLNGNEIERIEKKLLSLFTSLSHIRLGNNPLHCNCELKWLKEFFDKNPDTFKGAVGPSCLSSAPMKGKLFDQVMVTEFRCQPPFFNNIEANFHDSHGRLKCTATGDPAPSLYWIQPSGKATKYAPPVSDDVRKTVGHLLLNSDPGEDKSSLRGMYICVANNEAGNVTMTINVTWPSHPVPYDTVTYRTVGESDTTTTLIPLPANDAPRPVATQPVDLSPNPALEDPKPDSPKKPGGVGGINPNPSTSREGRTKAPIGETNYTAMNNLMGDVNPNNSGQRLFNLTELICAVIGTFVCTLLLCLIFLPMYLKRRWKSDRDHYLHNVSNGCDKSHPETMYLNGSNHVPDYMDIPTPTKR